MICKLLGPFDTVHLRYSTFSNYISLGSMKYHYQHPYIKEIIVVLSTNSLLKLLNYCLMT